VPLLFLSEASQNEKKKQIHLQFKLFQEMDLFFFPREAFDKK